jgi:hypothetical protein
MFKVNTTPEIEKLRAKVDPSSHPQLAAGNPSRVVIKQRRRKRKALLSRDELDGRTYLAKLFDQLLGAIIADLGGVDNISTIEFGLAEAHVGARVMLDHLNAKLLSGAAIDHVMVAMHAQCVSGMVKTGARLGLHRRQKPVTSTLGELIKMDQDVMRLKLAREREATLRGGPDATAPSHHNSEVLIEGGGS